MISKIILQIGVLISLALVDSSNVSCSAQQRLRSCEQVINAYAANPLQTYSEFDKIPFGVPNKAGGCITTIAANGLCPIPFSETGAGVVQFGTETRLVFSKVTGDYTDFPNNLTTVVRSNVSLGVTSLIPLPIAFTADVYFDFNPDCRIYQVRAVAWIPSEILGILLKRLSLPIPPTVCSSIPVKREAIWTPDEKRAVEFVA